MMCKDFKSAGVGTAKFVECMFIYIFFKVEKKTQKNNKLQTGLVYQVARIHSHVGDE